VMEGRSCGIVLASRQVPTRRCAKCADAGNIFQFRIAGAGDVFQRQELVQHSQNSI